jgi:hypothetical protein
LRFPFVKTFSLLLDEMPNYRPSQTLPWQIIGIKP